MIPRKLLLAHDRFNKSSGLSWRNISCSVSIGISVMSFRCPRRPLTYLSRLPWISVGGAWGAVSVSSSFIRKSSTVAPVSTFWRFTGAWSALSVPVNVFQDLKSVFVWIIFISQNFMPGFVSSNRKVIWFPLSLIPSGRRSVVSMERWAKGKEPEMRRAIERFAARDPCALGVVY
jgi:hypothetical protein